MSSKVLLKLECVTNVQEFVLLVFENIFDDFEHSFLAKVNKTVEDFEGVLIRYHVREQAEKRTG